MFKVIHKENKSWFEEPILASEVNPAQGWEVQSFTTYEEAQNFIDNLKVESE